MKAQHFEALRAAVDTNFRSTHTFQPILTPRGIPRSPVEKVHNTAPQEIVSEPRRPQITSKAQRQMRTYDSIVAWEARRKEKLAVASAMHDREKALSGLSPEQKLAWQNLMVAVREPIDDQSFQTMHHAVRNIGFSMGDYSRKLVDNAGDRRIGFLDDALMKSSANRSKLKVCKGAPDVDLQNVVQGPVSGEILRQWWDGVLSIDRFWLFGNGEGYKPQKGKAE